MKLGSALIAGLAGLAALTACATSGSSRFGLPASTNASYAAAPAQAQSRLRDICLPAALGQANFQAAVAEAGLTAVANPFNEDMILFPETSYTAPATPRLHVFFTEIRGARMCSIFAFDGDPDQVLSGWQAELRAAQARQGLGAEPVVLPAFEALEDGVARFVSVGGGVRITLSSDAKTTPIVANRADAYRVLEPATGVLLTVAAPTGS